MLKFIWGLLAPKFTSQVSGASNSTGFQLKVYNPNRAKQNLLFYSKSYNPEFKSQAMPIGKGFEIALGFFSLLYTLLCLLAFGNFATAVTQAVVGSICFLLIISFIASLHRLNKNTGAIEWHACEHKSIRLLEAGLSPTLKNLRDQPSVSIYCGTSILGVACLELPIFVLLLIWFGGPGITKIIPILGFCWGTLFLLLLLPGFMIDLLFKSKLYCVGLLANGFILPFTIVPSILEKLFTTKEPSREKMAVAVRGLRRFILKNNLYKI